MNSQIQNNKRNKILKLKENNCKSFEYNLNIRKKALSLLDSKLKSSFTNLYTLLEKINNVKDLVVFNKYDIYDLKSMKNLDNNAILFSRNIKNELKKSSKLLYAYNIDSLDLDNFLNELESKSIDKNKSKKNNEIKTIYKLKENRKYKKDAYNKLKKEFDLSNVGKTKHDKYMNSIFLKQESKMRDLYNLKLELFFKEQRKKIGENKYYEEVKKPPNCLREKDKGVNQFYSKIKSRYFDLYKLSQSYGIEEKKDDKNLNEEANIYEEKEIDYNNINQDNISQNDNKNNISYSSNKNVDDKKINNKNISLNDILLFNDYDTSKYNGRNPTNNMKSKKPVSGNITKKGKFNTYEESISFNNNSQHNMNIFKIKKNDNNSLKKSASYMSKRGSIYRLNNSKNHKQIHNKLFLCSYTTKNNRNKSVITNNKSKQTFYSSQNSSRPISAFTTINNSKSIYRFLNKNNKNQNLSMSLNKSITSKYRKKSFFSNYINEINKIIKCSNYNTNKFKKSSRILKNIKLFQKSNSEILEKTTSLDIGKINENLKLDKNKHSFIDDKKLIFNNSKKVKLMLTVKNRKLLNTILMELIDKQRRVNGFYYDLSHFEKMIQKFSNNKKYRKLANETMNYEKRFDKESILEIFKQDEEKIMEYLKEMSDKDKYDEEEWKHIILKHKNMKYITNLKNMVINGNLHKKHLVSKFKKEKK